MFILTRRDHLKIEHQTSVGIKILTCKSLDETQTKAEDSSAFHSGHIRSTSSSH